MTGENLIGSSKNYFVDEAGDLNLFNRRKKIVVATEGCSTFFLLGLIDVTSPDVLGRELEELRRQLLADPYFKGIPSMQPGGRKTALAFHAKDDIPEVRREVFSLLIKHDIRFSAIIRDKRQIVKKVQEHNQKVPGYRYHPNQLYDRCVSRLFKERLHQNASYRIVFAKRGTSDRTTALLKALETERSNVRRSHGVEATAPIEVVPSTPKLDPCLQAVDYFAWALQRLYEKQDERYWQFVWPKVRLVIDVDDVRRTEYGEYYSQKSPLDLGCLQTKTPGI
ncbi:MAG: DUF3800 domain-containing protein [Planctomycetaceae bacterium]